MNELLNEDLKQEHLNDAFVIDSLESATWVFRKLRALKTKINETNEVTDTEIKRIQEWKDNQNKQHEESIEYFEGLLREYYLRKIADDAKFKLSTPFGKVTKRKMPVKFIYNDEELIENLTNSFNFDFIRTKQEVNREALRENTVIIDGKVCTKDGEILDCIQIEQQEDKISIKIEE